MGWISELDTESEHEGWIAMTFAEGKISSGTSNYLGHYLDGYTYLPGQRGEIDPAFLRPWSEIVGWLPRCECGWSGVEQSVIENALPGITNDREPSVDMEELIMGQWRLHLRDTLPEA